MAISDILDTIIKGKDAVTGTTTYTNLASAAAKLTGTTNTGIPRVAEPTFQPASLPPSNPAGEQASPFGSSADIIKNFAVVSSISDPVEREKQTANIMMDMGKFRSKLVDEATAKAQQAVGLAELQDQLAVREKLDRAHPMWKTFQSDSDETASVRARLSAAQGQVASLASNEIAQSGELAGLENAAKVFLTKDTAGDKTAAAKARLAQAARIVAVDLGGISMVQAEAVEDEVILANKDLVQATANRMTKGSMSDGAYSSLATIENIAGRGSPLMQTGTAKWVQETAQAAQTDPMFISKMSLSKKPEDITAALDNAVSASARAAFRGDADSSLLTRLPNVGTLAQMPEVSNTQLFKTIAGSDPSTNYSLKQLIGFALKDDRYKSDNNARARLIDEISVIAKATNARTQKINRAFALPIEDQVGYRIMPQELLADANSGVPDSLKLRFFDLTKPADVQILVNLAAFPSTGLNTTLATGLLRLQGRTLDSTLREADTISNPRTKGNK